MTESLIGLVHQLGEGELAGPIDGNGEVAFALPGLHLGDVDVEVADRICPEWLPGGLVAVDLRQASDAVTLSTVQ